MSKDHIFDLFNLQPRFNGKRSLMNKIRGMQSDYMNTKHRICVTVSYYLYYTCNFAYCMGFPEESEDDMDRFDFQA